MLIGYGSQCWKDEVTPSGVECAASVFSTPDANVESRNLRHSLASSDSILLAGTSLDFLAVLRKVRGSSVQVISCEKHLLLSSLLNQSPFWGTYSFVRWDFFNPRYEREGSKL